MKVSPLDNYGVFVWVASRCRSLQGNSVISIQTISRQKPLNGACHKFYLGVTRMMLINNERVGGNSYKCRKSLIKYFEVTRQKRRPYFAFRKNKCSRKHCFALALCFSHAQKGSR